MPDVEAVDPEKKIWGYLRKIGGAVAYILFVLAFVEIALQIFYFVMAGDFLFNRTAPALYRREPFAGFANRPDISFDHHTNEFEAHYITNKVGFRVPRPGIEYAVKKPANVYRIMLLGPSFAYGWGVDYSKSFAGLLPGLLKKRGFAPGRNIEVINAGVPALPPASQLNWYEHVGKAYQPDLVMQFIYGTMTVTSNPHSTMSADDRGYLFDTTTTSAQHWRERLKQFATVFYGWVLWTEFENWWDADAKHGALEGAGRNMIEIARFDTRTPAVHDAVVFYENLARVTRASGAKLEVVYFPLSYILYPEDESRWRHLGVRDIKGQKAFDVAFANYLNEKQIPTLNLTDTLQKVARTNKKRLYYWLDIHWTVEGNAVVAETVANAMTQH